MSGAPTELLIGGGGPVGLALAVALGGCPRTVKLLDARTPAVVARDARVLALSHGARQILARLGVWDGLPVTPIDTIHVSQRGHYGRTVLRATEQDVPALGYVVRAGQLIERLQQRLADTGVAALHGVRLTQVAGNAADVIASVEAGDGTTQMRARLVAVCDGAVDAEAPGWRHDYAQHAVVCEARTAEPRAGTAYERFTADGPVALLPLDAGYAVVLVVPSTRAQALLALDEAGFLRALQAQFGERLRFVACGPRAAYPLHLALRSDAVETRCVHLGNAAQTLHPVAGQGFNLALRDVWTLAALLRDHDGDWGAPEVLARYRARRRLDRHGAALATDALVRLFSNDSALLALARGAGLALLDALPPARGWLAKRMIFGARAWP